MQPAAVAAPASEQPSACTPGAVAVAVAVHGRSLALCLPPSKLVLPPSPPHDTHQIDVPMSNCINSGISKIYILTQFNSTSLNRHLARTYK